MGAGAPIKVTIAFRTGFWAEGAMRRAYRWIGALAVALVACTPRTTTLASQEGDGNEQRRFAWARYRRFSSEAGKRHRREGSSLCGDSRALAGTSRSRADCAMETSQQMAWRYS